MVARHTETADQLLADFDVDLVGGLPASVVTARRAEYGENALPEEAGVPAWRKILSLLADKMTIVLIIAAVVSAVVSHEWETPVVILALASSPRSSITSRRPAPGRACRRCDMSVSVSQSRVRRDGREQLVSRTELVPGDIVLLEAGDAMPADGRVVSAIPTCPSATAPSPAASSGSPWSR